MKKTMLALAVIAFTPLSAHALLKVGAKASVWDAEVTGEIDQGVSVENDGLNIKSDNGTQLSVFFEHPVPLIPSLKLKSTDLKLDGKGTLGNGFNFAGKPIPGSTELASKIDLSHTDATLYWGLPIPLPKINVDFGITARMFDGEASVAGGSFNESVDLDLTLPMLYGAARVGSFFGVYAEADVNWIGFGDNKLTDMSAVIGYELPIPIITVGLEVGYRALSLETDRKDVDVDADFETDGLFYGLSASFGF